MPGPRAGLPHARGRDLRPRGPGLDVVDIVQGETQKEARDFYRYYVHEKGDWEAAKNMIDTFSLEINARAIAPERIKALQEAFLAGWGGLP